MSLIITDRDGHFIGVERTVHKNKPVILIKHRNFDRRDEPDSDDLYFSLPQARKLLAGMMKKKLYYWCFKKGTEQKTHERNLELERICIDAEKWQADTSSVEVCWCAEKDKSRNVERFQIHYSTSWIGMGEREAIELKVQLKEALKAKK